MNNTDDLIQDCVTTNTYNDDAAKVLPKIEENSVDMIFTDPPYNTTNLSMDKKGFDIRDYLAEFSRILKPNGWFFCFGPLELHSEIITSETFRFKFSYIWEKAMGMKNHHRAVMPMLNHEIIGVYTQTHLKKMNDLYFDKKALRTSNKPYIKKYNHNHRNRSEWQDTEKYNHIPDTQTTNDGYREGLSVLKYPQKNAMKKKERTAHPTQKPVELIKKIIGGYTDITHTILDPFMGSGTTVVAARKLNRRYIGIEINTKYYEIAKKRLYQIDNEMLEKFIT